MTPSVISPNSPDQTCPQEKQLPRSTINSWLCEKKWQSWHSPDKELILWHHLLSSDLNPRSWFSCANVHPSSPTRTTHCTPLNAACGIPFTNFSSCEKPAVSLTSMWRLSFHPYSPPSSLTVGLLSGRWHWALELWSAPNKKTKLQLSVSHPNPPTFTQLGHLLLLHTFYFWASFTFVHILLLHIFYFFTPAAWLCVISLIWNVFYIYLFCTSKIIFSIFGKRQFKWKNFGMVHLAEKKGKNTSY